MGFAFEHDLLAGRGDHGATGLGGVDIVAHLTVLIGIEVADGGCTVGLNARSCGVVVHTREDNIRLGVIGIVVLERVGHEASRPVLGVRPVVADITIPIVVLAGIEREGISTEEALGELAGVTVTDLVLAFGLHGGEVGGTVGGRRSFGLFENGIKTIGGDSIRSAFERFERITAGVEGLGGHGHKEAGVRTITTAECDLSIVDGKFIVGHANILVGAGIHFTPQFELGGLAISGNTLCGSLTAEIHRFEGIPSVVVAGRVRHFITLLERIVVVLGGEIAGLGGQRANVELVDREIQHGVIGHRSRMVNISVVSGKGSVERCGISPFVDRPIRGLKGIAHELRRSSGILSGGGEDVLRCVNNLELFELRDVEVRKEVFREIEFFEVVCQVLKVKRFELVGGDIEGFDVLVGGFDLELRFRIGRSQHVVVEVNETKCGSSGERGILEFLRCGHELPHTVLAGDLDHTAFGRGHIDRKLTIFRQIVHLADVLAVVFVVDEDNGPVIARYLCGVFGGKREGHRSGGRCLDERNAVEEIVGGLFSLLRGSLCLDTLAIGSHQQAGGQNGRQTLLGTEKHRETADR